MRRGRAAVMRRAAPRALWAAAAALLVVGSAGAAAADDAPLEDAVKATYLYKFAPFVEWPAALASSTTFNLCVVGQGPVADLVNRAAEGQRVGAQTIAVSHLQTVSRPVVCELLYIANSAADNAAEILKTVHGTPVLTVTNAAPDERSKGIINFVTVGNRVRFEIDNNAAADNGLVISSKLLSLAVAVRSR
jgi:YfiR/HmsC-like